MSDELNEEQPGEDLESDVSELLEHAESLSADLGSEVGAEATPPAEREKEFFESETDSEASLDLQIAKAESALDSAKTEIEEAPREVKKLSLPPRKSAEAPPAEQAFSKDRPATEKGKRESAQPVAAATQSAKAKTQAENSPGDRAASTKAARQDKQVDKLVAARLNETPYEFEPPQPSRIQTLCAKLNLSRVVALQEPLANFAARTLEICDRPFNRINRVTRLTLGWLSLALITAALAILMFMVF